MELPPFAIIGTRVASSGATAPAGQPTKELRAAWLSRMPSVEPGSLSSAYRSFRAQEAMTSLPSAAPAPSTSVPAILSGSVPAALAAYGEVNEE